MSTTEITSFEWSNIEFEKLSHQNGMLYWHASIFLRALGYTEFSVNAPPILKAMQVCTNTGITPLDHFIKFTNETDGKKFEDIKLTRFACYLVAMNADIKKTNVAKAQAYFASLTAAIHQYIVEQQDIERIDLRGQISRHEKALSYTAKLAGVENYAFFQNKGYLGLYNMSLAKLKELKRIPDAVSPLDVMGSEELGANIFRITQTDAKIKRENITGQNNLENAAFNVGRMVRKVLQENGSTLPEKLPVRENIKHIKSDIKKTNKAFNKKDALPDKS